MISRSSRWRMSNPITCCSVMRWASTPRGMECPQHKKTEGAFRPLERGVDRFINAYLAVNPHPPGSATPSSASPRRDVIRQAQERLQAAGFNPGAIDGALGPQTRDALRWFQNSKGIRATGEPDEVTLDALGVR